MTITHGILADKDWDLTMNLILYEPILPPSPEPKECWMDRKAYSLFQKKRIDHKEKYR